SCREMTYSGSRSNCSGRNSKQQHRTTKNSCRNNQSVTHNQPTNPKPRAIRCAPPRCPLFAHEKHKNKSLSSHLLYHRQQRYASAHSLLIRRNLEERAEGGDSLGISEVPKSTRAPSPS